jgi:hypothetical protein
MDPLQGLPAMPVTTGDTPPPYHCESDRDSLAPSYYSEHQESPSDLPPPFASRSPSTHLQSGPSLQAPIPLRRSSLNQGSVIPNYEESLTAARQSNLRSSTLITAAERQHYLSQSSPSLPPQQQTHRRAQSDASIPLLKGLFRRRYATDDEAIEEERKTWDHLLLQMEDWDAREDSWKRFKAKHIKPKKSDKPVQRFGLLRLRRDDERLRREREMVNQLG